MTLQQLKYIVAVAETGNMTEAAEKLFIAQPSLTNAIRNLENEMGITAFTRSNKGVELTREGEELLSYARQILEQADVMAEHFQGEKHRRPHLSVSCQHYSFAVNAFVDVIRKYDADEYNFTLRETTTYDIIDDVSAGRSDVGVLYLSQRNEQVLSKMLKKNDLQFEELFVADPHVFLSDKDPLSHKEIISMEDLYPHPYLVFEQGSHNSASYAEEFVPTLEFDKQIMVRDRATLFNLLHGLHGFTVSTGVIDAKINDPNVVARPLDVPGQMRVGIITAKQKKLSRYASAYVEALYHHVPR